MSDWNPLDPDATRVVYDLSGWSFEHQAELASDMADAEIVHSWDGTDLIVPEEAEEATDAVIAAVEQRLGIVDDTVPATGDDTDPEPGDGSEVDDTPPERIDLADGVPAVEYDLAEWTPTERELIATAAIVDGVPHRWEGMTLVIDAEREDEVDNLLDLIERGQIEFEPDDEQLEAERLPFETLTTFFLAGDRLRRNPTSPEGLLELVKAFEVADPDRPPYGVAARLWTRTCELAEELVSALVDGDQPDHDAAKDIADELHELLRPYV